MFDRPSDSNLISFPLPPSSSLQGHRVGGSPYGGALKPPQRSDSIPTRFKSVDVNLSTLQQSLDHIYTRDAEDSAFFASPIPDSANSTEKKIAHRLPQFPLSGKELKLTPSIHCPEHLRDLDVQPVRNVKNNCSRYPITYKLKKKRDFYQNASAPISNSTVWTAKTSPDPQSSFEESPQIVRPAPVHYSSFSSTTSAGDTYRCKSVVYTRVQPLSRSRSVEENKTNLSSFYSSTRPYSNTTSQYSLSPAQSNFQADGGRPTTVATHEDSEFESIQTEKLNLSNGSECGTTMTPRKSSVLERPRPVGRELGSSFTSPNAEYEQLTTLRSSNSCSINPGRQRSIVSPQPASNPQLKLPEKHTLGFRAHSYANLRSVNKMGNSRSVGSAGESVATLSPRRNPSFVLSAQRLSIASGRQSFFSTLAKLDSDGNSLNLELRMPGCEKRESRRSFSAQEHSPTKFDKNTKPGSNKLKKTSKPELRQPKFDHRFPRTSTAASEKPLPQLRKGDGQLCKSNSKTGQSNSESSQSDSQAKKSSFELRRFFSLRDFNNRSTKQAKPLFGCLGA